MADSSNSEHSPAGHPLHIEGEMTVRRALDMAGGIKKDAAEAMGISQRALSYYLAKHRIE